MSRRLRAPLRLALSVAILGALAVLLDARAIVGRLGGLRPGWVALALAISIPQALLLAWRWRFTAGRLGVSLPLRTALAEYYLGNFLNQVLPGGVTGDVSRAWRHARAEARTGAAVHAVVLERLTGQLVMTTVALISVSLITGLPAPVRAGGAAALAAGAAAFVAVRLRRPPHPGADATDDRPGDPVGEAEAPAALRMGALERFRADARQAVVDDGALAVQLGTGVVTVASYVAVYLVAARALGIETPVLVLAPLVAPVLMTMLLPVTVAGWGVREAAAAALWGAVGLGPEDGVAISVAYGGLVLLSALPGAVVLSAAGARGRRARRHPG